MKAGEDDMVQSEQRTQSPEEWKAICDQVQTLSLRAEAAKRSSDTSTGR
jgi:hypothetical protein